MHRTLNAKRSKAFKHGAHMLCNLPVNVPGSIQMRPRPTKDLIQNAEKNLLKNPKNLANIKNNKIPTVKL